MNIDWSKAPEGATHYRRYRHGMYPWYRITAEGKEYWNGAIWEKSIVISGAGLEPRPALEWNGEGLPPVGTVCEFQNSVGSWVAVEVTAIARKGICLAQPGRDGESYACQVTSKFRPIRTPEQIAKEAKSKACDKMYGVILDRIPPERRNNGSDICEALYDEGYRKIEGLTAE